MECVRRSTRVRKSVAHYDPLFYESDRHVRVALRKSKLEVKDQETDDVNGESDAASVKSSHFLDVIEDCPTVQPTLEEFEDPVSLWGSLRALGLRYGAVKLRPPEGWKPPFSLDLPNLHFKVRKQKLHRLASGDAFSFPDELWTAPRFQKYGDVFKAQRDLSFPSTPQSSDAHTESPLEVKRNAVSRPVKDWEMEYWRLVETQTVPVSVYYGADIEVSYTGSGFPNPANHNSDLAERSDNDTSHHSSTPNVTNAKSVEYYAKHPWNLLNLPNANGSLLQSVHYKIPGVTSPWLYFGMLFSSFCWHTEDNYFAAVNYQHFGDPKVWYVIPPEQAPAMQKLMVAYIGHRRPADVLHSLTVQISPALLKKNSIDVYRIEQHENEFVLLWPRTYHCGFNTGYNCNEACNIAPPIWLDWGRLAVTAYRHLRPACIAYEQVIYMAAASLVRFHHLETLQKLLLALARLVLQDYTWRVKASDIPQMPFLLRSSLPQQIEECFKTRTVKQESSCLDEDAQILTRTLDCVRRVTAENVDPYHATDEDFLAYANALARLPSVDCSQCGAACYQGLVGCSHTKDILCTSCCGAASSVWPCGAECDTAVHIYRFPLGFQLRLLELLRSRLNLLSSQSCSVSFDTVSGEKLESVLASIPTRRKVAALERRHARLILSHGSQPCCSSTTASSEAVFFDQCPYFETHEATNWDSPFSTTLKQRVQEISSRCVLVAVEREMHEEDDSPHKVHGDSLPIDTNHKKKRYS